MGQPHPLRLSTNVYCFYTLTDRNFAIFGLPVNNLVIQLGGKNLVNFWPGPRQPPPFTPRTIIPPQFYAPNLNNTCFLQKWYIAKRVTRWNNFKFSRVKWRTSSDGQNSTDSLKPIRESIVSSWIGFPFWIGFFKKSVFKKNSFFKSVFLNRFSSNIPARKYSKGILF